jgi:hypothetical protein
MHSQHQDAASGPSAVMTHCHALGALYKLWAMLKWADPQECHTISNLWYATTSMMSLTAGMAPYACACICKQAAHAVALLHETLLWSAALHAVVE